jgi:hypothetical protein
MRLLHRHDTTDDEVVADRPETTSDRRDTDTVAEGDRVPPDYGGPDVPDARTRTVTGPDYARDDERIAIVPERVATEDVVVSHWSLADALIALIGAGLAAVGIIVLVRTGVNSTWYRPVKSIFDANHTPLLGLIEAGTGAALVLAAVARQRFFTTLIGLAMAVGGVVAAIETSEWNKYLAIEDWWAWLGVAVGLVVALLALVPRRGHVDRVLRTG